MINRSTHLIAVALCLLTACNHHDSGPFDPSISICLISPELASPLAEKCDELTNAWGLMTIYTTVGQIIVAPSDTQTLNYQWATASFLDGSGNSTTTAGSVTLNNRNLPAMSSSYYLEDSLATLWNINSTNTWNIAGAGTVPTISFMTNGTLPDFTGTLPDTIFSTSGFTLNFNATNTTNAGLVRISIGTSGIRRRSNLVSTTNGTVSIPATEMQQLKNYISAHPNEPVLMELALISYTVQNFNNKPYAFAKTKTIVKNVVIN